MQICMMDYEKLYQNGKVVKLHCYGVGDFDVLSGFDRYINNPNCSYREKAAIPPGSYWIVDRPKGSLANQARAEIIDMANLYKNHHSEWFGLYCTSTMTDYIYINGVKRGNFRLHPLNTDGSGVSWGCITFYHSTDFHRLRRSLLGRDKVKVPGGRGLMAYGRIDVRGTPDFTQCDIR